MHLAYSALDISENKQQGKQEQPGNDRVLRFRAYQTTCNKFSSEIAEIQKFIPGWMPKFK